MSEPLPQPEDPEIKCISFQLIDEKVNNYVLTANDSGVGTWQPGGSGPTENVDCKSFRLSTNPAAGYILTSDAAGNGTWEPPTSSPNIVCNSFALNQSPYNGYVLTSNASGVGTWQDPYSSNARKIATIFKEDTSAILPDTNFAIPWTSINSGDLGLTLDTIYGGKQIINDTGSAMTLLLNTTMHWFNNTSSFINIWINIQPKTDNPNNPSQIGYYFYGQYLYTINATETSTSTTAIFNLPNGYAINVVVYSPNNTQIGKSATFGNSYCNLIRLD